MHAVLLNGHGGLDKLEYRSDIEVPVPKEDEVLINVKGAGINNTDINIIAPIIKVIKKIPLGSPYSIVAKAPATGAIIGAIPIKAITLDKGFADSSPDIVSLIIALAITVPTLPPTP